VFTIFTCERESERERESESWREEGREGRRGGAEREIVRQSEINIYRV
jgi:hypothetical protein